MKKILKTLVEWFFQIIGYSLILISISILFPNTIYIDNAYYGLWALLASIIIFGINKWIKPVLIWLTIPITALTFGLFYPFINVFILHITHFILGNHFRIEGICMSFLVAILISLIHLLMKHFIYQPFLKKEMKYE